VLAEIDAILRLLRVEVPDEETATPAAPVTLPTNPPSAGVGRLSAHPDRWGAPSPYLAERLANARVVAAGIFGEFDSISRRTRGLGAAVGTLKVELDRAAEELTFLHSTGMLGPVPEDVGPVSEGAAPPVAPPEEESPVDLAAAARPAVPEVYGAFTLAEYNGTMRALRERRRRTAAVVVVLAAVISAALVTVTYLAHEPSQPWWLAGLPFIWMIPVPFFVASFLGTHRVLKSTRFELPEAP
jgi:hypothetical protein